MHDLHIMQTAFAMLNFYEVGIIGQDTLGKTFSTFFKKSVTMTKHISMTQSFKCKNTLISFSDRVIQHTLSWGSGGGQVVGMLVFYSDKLSSYPIVAYIFFCLICV